MDQFTVFTVLDELLTANQWKWDKLGASYIILKKLYFSLIKMRKLDSEKVSNFLKAS